MVGSAALQLDVAAVLKVGNLLGRVLDTFVAAQLRPEVPLSHRRARLDHLRERNERREVDLLAELGAQQVAKR